MFPKENPDRKKKKKNYRKITSSKNLQFLATDNFLQYLQHLAPRIWGLVSEATWCSNSFKKFKKLIKGSQTMSLSTLLQC